MLLAVGGFAGPLDEWVVDEGFEELKNVGIVLANNVHDVFAAVTERAVDASNFEGLDENASETEGDFLWEFCPVHQNFEAVTEVDVHKFCCLALEHNVADVAVTEAKNVTADRGHCQCCGIGCATIQPVARVGCMR